MYIVEFYTSSNERSVVKDIYFNLAENQRSKIAKAIHVMKEFGISREIPQKDIKNYLTDDI